MISDGMGGAPSSSVPGAPRSAPEQEHAERGLGLALAFGAALLWSLGGLGIKVVDASPLAISGYRCLFALPVFLAVIGPRTLRAIGPGALRSRYVWGAAIAYAITLLTFVLATRLTTAANAIVLQYTGPIYVALLSGPLLGERVRRTDWLALLGVVAGMAIFSRQGLTTDGRLGIAMALVSGVAFAALPLFLRLEIRSGGTAGPAAPTIAILLGNAIGVVVTLPFLISGAPSDGFSWAVLAGLGAVQIGAAYALYAAGVRRLRAVETSLVTAVEPVLNPVWVALGTREIPAPAAIVGGAVIVLSVALQGVLPAMRRGRVGSRSGRADGGQGA